MTITHGFRSLAIAATLSLLPAFAGEPAPESVAPPPPVPGGSFVAMSDALRAEALARLGAHAQEKHGCATPRVLDTRTRSPKGRVRLGRDGQLLSGVITETWKVDICGTKRTITVVLSPPVEGASGVAISERD